VTTTIAEASNLFNFIPIPRNDLVKTFILG
jgi:hypothetical protein